MAEIGKPGSNGNGQPDASLKGAQDGASDPTPQGQDKASASINDKKPDKSGDELRVENERLKGQIAELQKQSKEHSDSFETFKKELGAVVGLKSDDDGDNKLETTVEGLQKQILMLRDEADQGKALKLLDDVIDTFRDEDGKPLPDEVKSFLRSDLDVNKPDRQAIETQVKNKAGKISQLLGGRFTGTNAPERRPGYRGNATGSHNPSANEILANLKKANA